jgi:hypothetical protein
MSDHDDWIINQGFDLEEDEDEDAEENTEEKEDGEDDEEDDDPVVLTALSSPPNVVNRVSNLAHDAPEVEEILRENNLALPATSTLERKRKLNPPASGKRQTNNDKKKKAGKQEK